MSFKSWSIAIVFLVMFGLVGVSVVAAVRGAVLAFVVVAALVMPALILREGSDVLAPAADDVNRG